MSSSKEIAEAVLVLIVAVAVLAVLIQAPRRIRELEAQLSECRRICEEKPR